LFVLVTQWVTPSAPIGATEPLRALALLLCRPSDILDKIGL
jgi:hypothetical protein